MRIYELKSGFIIKTINELYNPSIHYTFAAFFLLSSSASFTHTHIKKIYFYHMAHFVLLEIKQRSYYTINMFTLCTGSTSLSKAIIEIEFSTTTLGAQSHTCVLCQSIYGILSPPHLDNGRICTYKCTYKLLHILYVGIVSIIRRMLWPLYMSNDRMG